jgi:Cu/Ag efflux protein CusF
LLAIRRQEKKEVSMIRYITTAVVTCMVAFALNQGAAQETGESTTPPKTTERAKQMPFRGKIVKIDLEAKTVTLGGKEKDRTFAVTDLTKIKKNGQAAKIEDVRVGESVGGLARANGDKWEVVTLNVGEKPDKAQSKETEKQTDS